MNNFENKFTQAGASTGAHVRPRDINVLIACEESQAECAAFRARGFNAYSCDIQPCKKDANPYWHIQGDVTNLLHGDTAFNVQAGFLRTVSKWHLIVAHPPCTYLCKVSAVQMVKNGIIDEQRYQKMLQARSFFYECLNAETQYIAVENPLPMARAGLPKPSCFVSPEWFGHKYTKKTLYWLKNLPPLLADGAEFPNPKCFVRSSRGKYRSRTFKGVAEAIAKQWGDFILDDLNRGFSTKG